MAFPFKHLGKDNGLESCMRAPSTNMYMQMAASEFILHLGCGGHAILSIFFGVDMLSSWTCCYLGQARNTKNAYQRRGNVLRMIWPRTFAGSPSHKPAIKFLNSSNSSYDSRSSRV